MAKAITLGNGHILVNLDNRAQVRDFYFPYVGYENHVGGHYKHHIGVYAKGTLRWFDHPSWSISSDCHVDSGSCRVTAHNSELGVSLSFKDIVYNEKNIFLRDIEVTNHFEEERLIKIYFGQQFRISESRRGDTGYYDPRCRAIIHYKGKRAFLINTKNGNDSFDEYSVGLFEIEGKEGTHVDAEDGILSQNPIEHGLVDSVIGMSFTFEGKGEKSFYYWIAVGKSVQEVHALNAYVLTKSPEHLIKTTEDFWHAWVNRQNFSFYGLPTNVIDLFKKSLLIVRAHADNDGAIIASGDSDMLNYGRDTYSYVWPRDGARSALALARAGSFNTARNFFNFCNNILTEEGYFMHKYSPDGSLGSSWHPWIRDGNAELPIQEDETALVLHALWKYYELSRDLEFIEDVYNSLIERAADFLIHYRFKDTYLPYPSYDLWEEKYGIATFTCSAVFGALQAAARFANLLGKHESEEKYERAALKMQEAILKYLYREDMAMFAKLVTITTGGMLYDRTIDMSSFYGIYAFDVLPPGSPELKIAAETIEKKLRAQNEIKGVPRYENDKYLRMGRTASPNPWFVTTLWLAQFYIREAENEEDLEKAKGFLSWVSRYARSSGVLSEQLHPVTGEQLSAGPLTWSHSEFVITVIDYLEKLEEFGVCKACNPVK